MNWGFNNCSNNFLIAHQGKEQPNMENEKKHLVNRNTRKKNKYLNK